MDKTNTAMSSASVIIAVCAAISTILYAVSGKKRYKKASVLFTGLTAIIAVGCFFSNDRLSDLRKTKEQYDSIKLANYSTSISKSLLANKELQDKLDKAEKGIAKLIKVDTSKSDKHVKLPASGKFTYEKTDNSAHKVIITPSVPGQTIGSGLSSYELSGQDENVTLELSGTKWSITH